MAAVLRVLPLLSPRQCSICLSCVTLLEWQPARPWVLLGVAAGQAVDAPIELIRAHGCWMLITEREHALVSTCKAGLCNLRSRLTDGDPQAQTCPLQHL
eukprot:1162136-Pelagomonas_calceolata.AAC.19